MSFLTWIQKADGRKLRYAIGIAVVILIGINYLSFKTSMRVTPGDTALTIHYRSLLVIPTTYVVNYADIERAEIFEKAPSMRRNFGTSLAGVRIGTFSTPDLGKFKVAIDNVNRPVLFIKTKEQGYMVSPDDAAVLKQTIESKSSLR